MNNTSTQEIIQLAEAQKRYFGTGATLNTKFRKQRLKQLLAAINKWEQQLCDALWTDLHKSYEEAFLTEISIVKAEIKMHIKKINCWAKRRKISTPLKLFPSRSYIIKEPLGNALIIAP